MQNDHFLQCTENGSVDMDTMPKVLEHLDKYARRFVPAQKPILLLLDNHASRNGVVWIEYAKEREIVAILLTSITTHFLQPCNNKNNKSFQTAVCSTRDELLAMTSTNVHDMGFVLKLAAAGRAPVTPAVVRESFCSTRLWPMDFRFGEKMRTAEQDQKEQVEQRLGRLKKSYAAQNEISTVARRTDAETWSDIQKIVSSARYPIMGIAKVAEALREGRTAQEILQGMQKTPTAVIAAQGEKGSLRCRALAVCLTIGNLLGQRKAKQEK